MNTPAFIKLLTTWVLGTMINLQPHAPWETSYGRTAEVLAKIAAEEPLFAGEDGPRKTASWFVSVAWFESNFNPKAEGDCRVQDAKKRCIAQPQSFCLFQIGSSNFASLGVNLHAIMNDPEVCTRAARKMMKISIGVCRSRPIEDWLGQYASGGENCGGLVESRHRVNKAKWIFGRFPWASPGE